MFDILVQFLPIAALGAAASSLLELLTRALRARELDKKPSDDLRTRIDTLTQTLHQSVDVIDEVRADVEARHQLAENLRADVEQYEALLAVKKPEVEAIMQVFSGEVQRQNRRSFWMGVLVNFVFFLLGAGLTVLVT